MSKPRRPNDPYKNGSRCPYCDRDTIFVDSKEVYGRSYGMIYMCRPCHAWVGVHGGTKIALGRLANAELREAKKEAHKYFNMIYELKIMTRPEAYAWLSGWLEIPSQETHIGMFDVELCQQTIIASKQLLNDMRRLDIDFGAEPKTPYFVTN